METILHSDQGPIYTSQAFNTEFDNPTIESFNSWMKDELKHVFKDKDDIYEVIEEYIHCAISYF